ncbi:DUF6599 family protein [Magnetococcales bacterium HHB-1]
MDSMPITPRRHTPWPIRAGLLLLLPIIALTLYWDGQNFIPEQLHLQSNQENQGATLLPEALTPQWQSLGQGRYFSEKNLYEYVNGHAEYYLGAGFQGLWIKEYARKEDKGEPAITVDLFDMGKPLHAFGVLMEETPDNAARWSSIGGETTTGFHIGQGAAFAFGRYFIKINLFAKDVILEDLIADLLKPLIHTTKNESLQFYFPNLGKEKETRFIKTDYRGMPFFKNVIERRFEYVNEKGVVDHRTAFSIHGNPKTLSTIKQALLTQLLEDEIPTKTVSLTNELILTEVKDPYEGAWFFILNQKQFLGVFTPWHKSLRLSLLRFFKSS